jgi:uncharacterized membrane protein
LLLLLILLLPLRCHPERSEGSASSFAVVVDLVFAVVFELRVEAWGFSPTTFALHDLGL